MPSKLEPIKDGERFRLPGDIIEHAEFEVKEPHTEPIVVCRSRNMYRRSDRMLMIKEEHTGIIMPVAEALAETQRLGNMDPEDRMIAIAQAQQAFERLPKI